MLNTSHRWTVAAALSSQVVLTLVWMASSAHALEFPGKLPGKARATNQDGVLTLENDALLVRWIVDKDRLKWMELTDRIAGTSLQPGDSPLISIQLADGRTLASADLRLAGPAKLVPLVADTAAVRRADRSGGWQIVAPFVTADGGLRVDWQATLRDDANYVTIGVGLTAVGKDVAAKQATLVVLPVAGAEVRGTVDGSPVVGGGWFFACEYPMARNLVLEGRVNCGCDVLRPLRAGETWRRSAVIGVAPKGQLRRAYLYYVERERPRPYQVFVHYNSWWDIAWGDRKMSDRECLDVIEGFGVPLTQERGVPLDSLCFDDGWDDNKTLWRFHTGFPAGFTPLKAAAEKYQSSLGVWLSPWGGYGQAKAERMQYGKTQSFETNKQGFSLAGPRYYERFRDVCFEMIRNYRCNYFKFDGIAQGVSSTGAGEECAADVAALLQLVDDMRKLRPDLFVNITTGTWPSPYWLWHGDSIWRNGHDVGFHGAGSVRQQSITYRDMFTYRMIKNRAPLFPLNSLMICSVVYAQRGTAQKMNYDVADLADEVRMAFAGGTQCLELYMTPQMMKPAGWDALAEATRWARANGAILVDTHWVGGDPGVGQAYGYASWSPKKGILALRNPGAEGASITLQLAAAFELPTDRPTRFLLQSPWKADTTEPPLALEANKEHTFSLKPFQTLVLEAIPEL